MRKELNLTIFRRFFMKKWDSVVRTYEEVLIGRGLEKGTISDRIVELDKFGLFLKRQKPLPSIEDLKEHHFVDHLKKRVKFKSKSTASRIMSHLRCFGNFLIQEKLLGRNPMIWLQGPKLSEFHRTPKRVSKESLLALWTEASKNLNSHNQHLLFVILCVLYGTGLRRGELERLKLLDLGLDEGFLILDGHKSKCERKIPLPPDVLNGIRGYLPFRQNALIQNKNNTEERLLFIDAKGRPIKGKNISKRLQTLARRSGVKIKGLHEFRHTCASDLLGSGFRIDQVRDILGHTSVATTMRYFHISAPERKAAMSLHPINKMLKDKINGDEK
jgi:site-specific recombinase XerD